MPLDVLKIKAQTNPEAFRGGRLVTLVLQEGRGLYAGAATTALRNAPGSFCLFGGAEAVYQYAFHLQERNRASVLQHFVASCVGGAASITVSAPLDVVKTRIQNQNFGAHHGRGEGIRVLKDLIANEGISALFKGLGPKLLIVGPKLVFSMTVAQWLIGYFTVGSTDNRAAHGQH